MMEEVKDKPKRIICKAGNVFCVEVEGLHKRFFQYLGNDLKCLGGNLVRVFKKRYPMEYEPVIEDIISDKVDFYKYTWVYWGVKDGFWYRVGTSKDLGNLEKIYFIDDGANGLRDGYVEEWSIYEAFSGERIYCGKLSAKYQILERRYIFPPKFVSERICEGYDFFLCRTGFFQE